MLMLLNGQQETAQTAKIFNFQLTHRRLTAPGGSIQILIYNLDF